MNLYFSRKFPGGALPYKRLIGCAGGWGRIFTTGLTMMGSHFSIELLEWGRAFSDFWGKKVLHISG